MTRNPRWAAPLTLIVALAAVATLLCLGEPANAAAGDRLTTTDVHTRR